ncbi:YqzL family protein [Caenibacillus caldisaponilyticus]|jgi:hypothetical protein|nr:YqzL family protein [Caenibacillus caldisaponilyticus]
MLDFTWKVFCMTGNIDTYLLYKELERGNDDWTAREEEGYHDQPAH